MSKLATLIRNWAGTSTDSIRKDWQIDKRKFSKSDLEEAWFMGMLNKDGTFSFYTECYPSIWKPAVLWELLEKSIKQNTGFSLTSNKVWRDLGLWENGHRSHSQKTLQEMEAILTSLDLAGYISFNVAGSIWDISIK